MNFFFYFYPYTRSSEGLYLGWSGETGESGDSGKSCESGKSGTSGQTDMSVGIIIHQISGQISKSLRSRSVSVTNITSCGAKKAGAGAK